LSWSARYVRAGVVPELEEDLAARFSVLGGVSSFRQLPASTLSSVG
jgi:hypothetical protein